jgi:hypothetical protein
MSGMHAKLIRSPYPGLAIMIGGLGWQAISNSWTPQVVWMGGSIYTIAALFLENWRLGKEREPRLRLVFSQESPFVRDKPTYTTGAVPTGGYLRVFGVGITNSGKSADDVAVKLVGIEPKEHSERFGLSLRVLDARGDDKSVATVNTTLAEQPVIFYEVLTQNLPHPNAAPEWTALRFADDNLLDKMKLSGQDRYFITLQIDGDGAGPRQRFVVQKNERGQYDMREALY